MCIFLFKGICFGQYSIKDRDLVKTTFTRSFDRAVELNYLHSSEPSKVIAGLLSVAQSGDTLFNQEIEKLDFKKFAKYICFALAEAGPDKDASAYLIKHLKEYKNSPVISGEILEALGKTGDKDDYNNLTGMYLKDKGKNFQGISQALLNFYLRKIGDTELSVEILLDELKNYFNDSERYFEAAFTLQRIGVPKREIHLITGELDRFLTQKAINPDEGSYTGSSVACLLGLLSKAGYFPYDPELKSDLLSSTNYVIKIEAARAISYFSFTDRNDLIDYLKLLDDRNINVAQVLAASLKNLKTNPSLSDFIEGFIRKAVSDNRYDTTLKGKLVLSYVHLFPTELTGLLQKFSQYVPPEYIYEACTELKNNGNVSGYLLDSYIKAPLKDKDIILSAAVKLRSIFPDDNKLKEVIENALDSDHPSLISLSADGMDSLLIKEENNSIRETVLTKIKKYKNNPDYYESLLSLAKLSEKVGRSFADKVLTELSGSNLYNVRKFALKALRMPLAGLKKDSTGFNSYWTNAFKYKGAEIKTGRGIFKIKFLPQFAPVTVGNFCKLTLKKFFNGIEIHRVVPGFVIQGGDPTGTGWGGPGYDIVSEFSPESFGTGAAGMASAGKDTEGSQWFVMTGIYPHLNGRYTLFARVIDGQKIADETVQGDRIINISLF